MLLLLSGKQSKPGVFLSFVVFWSYMKERASINPCNVVRLAKLRFLGKKKK
jgi:hypothetical protein